MSAEPARDGVSTWCCQLQDSELARVARSGDQLQLHLAAACLRPGVSPVGPATAYGHGLVLHLSGARCEGDIASALGRVLAWDWRTLADGSTPQTAALPLPWSCTQALRLHLHLQATQLDIWAQAAHLDWHGPPRMTEAYAC